MSVNHPFGYHWRGGLVVLAIVISMIVYNEIAHAVGWGWLWE